MTEFKRDAILIGVVFAALLLLAYALTNSVAAVGAVLMVSAFMYAAGWYLGQKRFIKGVQELIDDLEDAI